MPQKHASDRPCVSGIYNREKYKAYILKYKALISKIYALYFYEVPFFFAFRYGVFYNGNFPVSYAVFLFFFALNFKLFSIANENSHVQIECMVVSKGFMALQIFVQ